MKARIAPIAEYILLALFLLLALGSLIEPLQEVTNGVATG